MFCYAYGDYFGLYVAGTLTDMNKGMMGPLGHATPGILIAVSIMMALPSLMIVLSLVLPAAVSRWLNVAFGLVYTAIMATSLSGAEPFYVVMGVIEIVLTMTIVLIALRWPRAAVHD